MTKAEEAAQWMWAELQQNGWLSQHDAVSEIAERFGEEMTYINNNGNPAIDKSILKHFKRLHGGKAQWYKSPDGYWRLDNTE